MSIHALPSKLRLPSSRDISTSESHHLVRERNFLGTNVDAVLSVLHSEHATGQIIVDISQGSVGSVRFREQHKVSPFEK